MSLISIIGTPLYQWETGRKLKIIPLRGMRVDSVHISNYGDSTALVVKPREENGAYIADIPNILLQDDRSIAVYSVNVSEDKTETLRECVFSIQKRAKPSDYIYTETEVFTYRDLEERMKKLEENGVSDEQIADAVKGYLEQNPIKETDPSVPDWAKSPEKPKYSAKEVGALSEDALQDGVNLALLQAKESGEFDGKDGEPGLPGKDGDDYILTDEDKREIADMIPVPEKPTYTAKEVGAIPEGGDPDATVHFESAYLSDIMSTFEVNVRNIFDGTKYIIFRYESDSGDDNQSLSLSTEQLKPVILRNLAYPEQDADAATKGWTEDRVSQMIADALGGIVNGSY